MKRNGEIISAIRGEPKNNSVLFDVLTSILDNHEYKITQPIKRIENRIVTAKSFLQSRKNKDWDSCPRLPGFMEPQEREFKMSMAEVIPRNIKEYKLICKKKPIVSYELKKLFATHTVREILFEAIKQANDLFKK
jgi:hypothetical protein